MKQERKTSLLAACLLLAISVTADAADIILAKGTAATLNGHTLTATSALKDGDRIAVQKGSVTIASGSCKNTTIPAKHYLDITSGKCVVMLDDAGATAGKVARIDPNTANLPCTNCKAALASKVATTKLILGAVAIGAAAAIANANSSDNQPLSP